MSTQYTPAEIVDLAVDSITGHTAAGDMVRGWRVKRLQDSELPAVLIYVTASSESHPDMQPTLSFDRTDTLHIECHAKDTADADAAETVSGMMEECARRIFANMDVRKEFEPQQNVTKRMEVDSATDYVRVVGSLDIDMRQRFTYEDIRTDAAALNTVRSTMDIDEGGDAPDVYSKATVTGGTP